MTDAHALDSIARADRAEMILETLRQRAPAEADLQASAMVMAGLKLLQEVRGTPAVLDTLSRIGPALVAECEAPPAPIPAPAMPPEAHAEQLYAIVAARPDADARSQADAMMNAATAVLIDRDGIEGALAALGRLVDRARAVKPALAAPEPADLVDTALGTLRALPPEVAKAQARAAIVAATAFLGELGAASVVGTPSLVPERVPSAPPEQLVCAMVDQLRGLDRGEAHERARAVAAGAAGYLHEAFGRTYASAVLAGVLDAAAAYGDEIRGGRDSLDTLH